MLFFHSRMKAIIQAMRTLPPLALNTVPTRCPTRSPGKPTHREFANERGQRMLKFVLSQTSLCSDTTPRQRSSGCPMLRSLRKIDEGLSQP